jgi:hypothetical protein
MRDRTIRVRALRWTGVRNGASVPRRSRTEGFGGGARKAMEKSRAEEGEEGVTMIAGRESFSVFKGRERSESLSRACDQKKVHTYRGVRVSRYSLCGEENGAVGGLARQPSVWKQETEYF